eukprot:COSAG02_NODE_11590_length_1693_cov_1.294228_1_plen_56_part_10
MKRVGALEGTRARECLTDKARDDPTHGSSSEALVHRRRTFLLVQLCHEWIVQTEAK